MRWGAIREVQSAVLPADRSFKVWKEGKELRKRKNTSKDTHETKSSNQYQK